MPTFTQDDPFWSPSEHAEGDKVVHLVDHQVDPGDMATALCGHRWKVERVHSRRGIGLATCDDCLSRARPI